VTDGQKDRIMTPITKNGFYMLPNTDRQSAFFLNF